MHLRVVKRTTVEAWSGKFVSICVYKDVGMQWEV